MKKILFALCLFMSYQLFAGAVDTISVASKSMRKSIKCVVIKPDSYKIGSALYPTVYLLHGHGGRYDNWIKRVNQLKEHADKIYVLERGEIVETGRHEELIEQKGLYYAMWRQQIGERKLVPAAAG